MPGTLGHLQVVLDKLPWTKKCIATKAWHKVSGELRSMTLAVPGLRGMFSLVQETLRHSNSHMRLTQGLHNFLNNIRWLHANLDQHPTYIHKTYPRDPFAVGACDACAEGMGGVYFLPSAHSHHTPYLWRTWFPDAIQDQDVSYDNPQGAITNSDLELAAIVALHDIAMQLPHPKIPTIFTASDNTPAIALQHKRKHNYHRTCRLPLTYSRYAQWRCYPVYAHVARKCNAMADDCSCLWHLDDSQLLTYFDHTYPQATPWRLHPLCATIYFSLISALWKK